MRNAEQILAFVLWQIGNVYRRPRMYGVAGEEVEGVLWVYHNVWAEIVDRRGDFGSAVQDVAARQGHGAWAPANHFRREVALGTNPSEEDVTKYVIDHWKLIDEELGLSVPVPVFPIPNREVPEGDDA
jgi:hypothetical protein